MSSEKPTHMVMEGLDSSSLKVGDEVLAIEFICRKCKQPFTARGPVNGIDLADTLQSRCRNLTCLRYSGFELGSDAAEKRQVLFTVLTDQHLRPVTQDALRELPQALVGRNLILRFKVKRLVSTDDPA